MKHLICTLLLGFGLLQVSTVNAQRFGYNPDNSTAKEQHNVLIIQSNGVSHVRLESVISRDLALKTVRMLERMKQWQARVESDETAEPPVMESNTNQPPLGDDELIRKLRELTDPEDENQRSMQGRLAEISVVKDSVRMVTTNQFESLEDLAGSYIWSRLLWNAPVQAMRVENDTNGNVRLSITPPPKQASTYFKATIDQWKNAAMQAELRLEMPGRILSSPFPNTTDRATWVVLNGTNDASVQAFRTLMATSIVVVAEAGGLKLDAPVDSASAWRKRRGGNAGDYANLPLANAGPGYIAQPDAAQITTVYHFPEGTNLLKDVRRAGLSKPGLEVEGKLFAPKGRTLLAVSDVRLSKALDDKGRAVPVEITDPDDYSSRTAGYVSSSAGESSAQLSLQLSLPETDAKALEEVSGEAVIVTAGQWKEMTLTNIFGLAGTEVDLSGILPGARLTVLQETNKNRPTSSQLGVTLKIDGPPEIKQFKVEREREDDSSSGFSVGESNSSYGRTANTRRITISLYGMAARGEAFVSPLNVIVKYPTDLRREKVSFKLNGIDLF